MRRFTARVVGTSFGLLYAVAACSSPSRGAGASGSVSLEQLPARFAAKLCESLAPCCQANGTPYDSATCQQTAQADLAINIAKLNKATILYDAAAAGPCIDAYASALGSCSETQLDSQAFAACNGVFTGTLPAGATCTVREECAKPAGGTAYCNTGTMSASGSAGASGVSSGGSAGASAGSGGAPGTCVQETPSPHGKAGDACAGNCTVTANSVGCSSTATPGTGVNITAVCYGNEGLYCGATSTATGTVPTARVCKPIAALGSPCSGYDCVDGAFCNAGTCAAQYDSGPCGPNAYDACSGNSYCDYSSGNVCVPRLADGAVCTNSGSCQSDHCQYPAATSSSGGTSPPAGGGSGGASPAVTQGVCAKLTFATPKACMGKLDD